MKKFLLPLSLAAVFFILCFTGCNNSAKNSDNDGWIEVQSITYYLQDNAYTHTSNYVWDYTEEKITQEEFCTATNIAPEDLSSIQYPFPLEKDEIPADRQELFNRLKSIKNSTKYSFSNTYNQYHFYKRLYTDYTIFYIKVRFCNDGSLEWQYKNEKKRIKPLSYEITYFS